jgi:fluoride exporter
VTEPIDPDVDLHVEAQRRELDTTLLVAVSVGGGLGALARYGLSVLVPTGHGGFPLATFLTNVAGCLAIGALMVLVTERKAHRLARPFLGVGVLGGFTTFSAYAVETDVLLRAGHAGVALGYVAATLAGALLAVLAGTAVTRAAMRRRS